VSLLGIDIGTTGCKAVAFSTEGRQLSLAYEEYNLVGGGSGRAELDAAEVWRKVQQVIRAAVAGAGKDTVSALAVSSMGEAMVPVSADRTILGPSLTMLDTRGEEYLEGLSRALDPERLYRINGNTLGVNYSLPKLMWTRDHEPAVYQQARCFLLWSGFVAFMLGAEPRVDYSLANRTLLFDIDAEGWSAELAAAAGIDLEKLPRPVQAGTRIGEVSGPLARQLGLAAGTAIVAGAHDQCANSLGCGVIEEGSGMCGMGTYLCLVPVFSRRIEPRAMLRWGLNTEHHAAPGRYVSFIYNQAGLLLKWYRDTFARREKEEAARAGADIYDILLGELPAGPSSVVVLPHFTMTGPPEFVPDSSGVIVGLKLDTSRGDILKGILEGTVFYHKEVVDALPATGIRMHDMRAVGGGSRSRAWVQLCADILEKPVVRARVNEAGCLGAAILAGAGSGVFGSLAEGARAMVALGDSFDPDPARVRVYRDRFERYRALWPLMKEYLRQPARR
jgi:xylulokinase